MREIFQAKGLPLVGGHRGASEYYPENTMLSFQKALEMGADYIELDVHLSKDEVPVIIHDAVLERTTNGKGKVSDYMLDDLKQLDAGRWFGDEFSGLEIPTLKEVLEWAKGKIGVDIELKQDNSYPRLEEKVAEAIKMTGTIDQVMAMSFNHKAVKKIKDLEPRLFTGITLFAHLYDPISVLKQTLVKGITIGAVKG